MNAVAPSGDLNVAKNSDTDIFGGEAGVVKALSTLRQAAISPTDKDSLRNLFLTYAGENDEAKRSSLKDQILEQIKKHPQLSSLIVNGSEGEKTTAPKDSSNSSIKLSTSLGQTRPTPNFVATSASSEKIVEKDVPAPVVPQAKEAEVVAEKVVPVSAPTPVAPPPAPQPPEPTPPAPKEAEPIPAPAPTSAPTPEPTAPVTDVRARIDAIKHDINGRVGNPVNVINADEKIGREYMSALLDAMKRSSAGGGAESLPRLEAAYKATLDLIIEKGLGHPTDAPTETKSVETEVKTPEIPATPQPEAPAPKVAEPEPTPEVQAPTPMPEPAPEPTPEKVTPTQQSEGLYHKPSDEIEAELAPGDNKLSSFASKFFKSPEPSQKGGEKSEAPRTAIADMRKVEVKASSSVSPDSRPTPESTQPDKLQPLQNSSATLPEKMAAIKSASAKREEEAKKPITDLQSPQIEAGLRQLLSEWVLFKKSGFLGTGPSGIDHPLYKQLASMPMAAVVSGRFEGVTPEIKRHLSDYMTGWRYEQGVMHEMGETFENYLRRVIRQVLERQRTRANKES